MWEKMGALREEGMAEETARKAGMEMQDKTYRLVVTCYNFIACHRRSFTEFLRQELGDKAGFAWLEKVCYNRFASILGGAWVLVHPIKGSARSGPVGSIGLHRSAH